MRHLMILGLGALSVTACKVSAPSSDIANQHPFIGCWENSSGLEREGWTIDPSGWLVGYAASRDADNNVTFFEHMRIEQRDMEVLVVTGQDNSETRFTRLAGADPDEYRFENPAHDYPQVIVYKRNGDALNAYIALMDGTKKVNFDKRTCKGG